MVDDPQRGQVAGGDGPVGVVVEALVALVGGKGMGLASGCELGGVERIGEGKGERDVDGKGDGNGEGEWKEGELRRTGTLSWK